MRSTSDCILPASSGSSISLPSLKRICFPATDGGTRMNTCTGDDLRVRGAERRLLFVPPPPLS